MKCLKAALLMEGESKIRVVDLDDVTGLYADKYGHIYRLNVEDITPERKPYATVHTNGNKTEYVHRIVARARVENPNPDGLKYVNHKDEDPSNNRADNLEWCTHKYNCNYGTRNKRIMDHRFRDVQCVETGEIFQSKSHACKWLESIGKGNYKANTVNILHALRDQRWTCGGFHWIYR